MKSRFSKLIAILLSFSVIGFLIYNYCTTSSFDAMEEYGKEYGASLISEIQDASGFYFTLKTMSYDHSSVHIIGSESILNPARFPQGTIMIPASNDTNTAIQTIVSSMIVRKIDVIDVDNDTATPDDPFANSLTLYAKDNGAPIVTFDMSTGLLRKKETYNDNKNNKKNIIVIYFEVDPSATNLLISQMTNAKNAEATG